MAHAVIQDELGKYVERPRVQLPTPGKDLTVGTGKIGVLGGTYYTLRNKELTADATLLLINDGAQDKQVIEVSREDTGFFTYTIQDENSEQLLVMEPMKRVSAIFLFNKDKNRFELQSWMNTFEPKVDG